MENTLLKDFFSFILESEYYMNSSLRQRADEIIFKKMSDIQKVISTEEYKKIEDEIYIMQSLNEEKGFWLGFRYAIMLMSECKFYE